MDESIPFRDTGRYSASTIITHKAIFKLVKKLNFDPYAIDDRNIENVLNAIKNYGNSQAKQRRYSRSYMSVIVSTLRAFNPTTLSKHAAQLGLPRENNDQRNIERGQLFPFAKQMIINSMQKLNDNFGKFEFDMYRQVNLSRVEIDSYIAVSLVLCTNMRGSEIFQLNMGHLLAILNKTPVTIRIKKKVDAYVVTTIDPLFSEIFPSLIRAIGTVLILNNESEHRLNVHRINNTIAKKDFGSFVMNPTQDAFRSKYVISCSKNSINKKLKGDIVVLGANSRSSSGLNFIRTVNTTLLLKSTTPEITALFNRHNSAATTLKYYNMPDVRGTMESLNVFKSQEMDGIMKDINVIIDYVESFKENITPEDLSYIFENIRSRISRLNETNETKKKLFDELDNVLTRLNVSTK